MWQILILERDDLIRGLLAEWLVEAGYEVQLGDPWRALSAKADDRAIGLIIADICMPKGQGAESIRMLKLAYPGAPIIAVSARFLSGIAGCAAASRQLGVRKILSKPFTREELLDALRSVIDAQGEAHG